MFGSRNYLCVFFPLQGTQESSAVDESRVPNKMPNSLALQLCPAQTEGKQKAAQGRESELHAGGAEYKRMRFPVIPGTWSAGAVELNRKAKWLPISRLFLVLF